jgi:hypothetical protein
VNSIYQQLRGFYGREQHMALTDFGTDIFTNGDQVSGGAQAWFYLNDYTSGLNSTDGRIQELWNPLYVLIARANVVIDAAPNVPTGGDLPATLRDSRVAEARFLRALAYFELVQQFGDITLNLSAASGVSTEAARAPQAEVYDAIVADLEAAVAALPETQAEFGRAQRGAAQHLLAKVLLTRGYKSFGEGNADFQRALQLSQAVISSGRHPLTPVYADLFCGVHTADQNAPDPNRQGFCNVLSGFNERHSEILFSVQYSYSPAQVMGPQCGNAAGVCGNYLHLTYLTRYDNDNTIAVGLPRDLNNGRPFRRIRGTPFLFHLFDQTRWTGTPGQSDIVDTRFDGTFQTLWYANASGGRNGTDSCPQNCTNGQVVNVGDTALWMPGYQVTEAFRRSKKFTIYVPCVEQGANPPSANCGQNNKLRRIYGWEVSPSVKKHQDNGRTGGLSDELGGKDVILMRSGETYLIAAEAAFKLNQMQLAADMINVLRQRAASAAHKSDWRQFMEARAGDITLDFIMDERARELAAEGTRWQDLTRPGPEFFVARVKRGNFEAMNNVRAFHALRPIPQQQINGVTGAPYAQNPGY